MAGEWVGQLVVPKVASKAGQLAYMMAEEWVAWMAFGKDD